MGTYCQVITSKRLVCCELARRAKETRMRQRAGFQRIALIRDGHFPEQRKRPVCPHVSSPRFPSKTEGRAPRFGSLHCARATRKAGADTPSNHPSFHTKTIGLPSYFAARTSSSNEPTKRRNSGDC